MDDGGPADERLVALKARHRELDEEIARLTATPGASPLVVQRLKKQKLQLKDVIAQLESDQIPDIIA